MEQKIPSLLETVLKLKKKIISTIHMGSSHPISYISITKFVNTIIKKNKCLIQKKTEKILIKIYFNAVRITKMFKLKQNISSLLLFRVGLDVNYFLN